MSRVSQTKSPAPKAGSRGRDTWHGGCTTAIVRLQNRGPNRDRALPTRNARQRRPQEAEEEMADQEKRADEAEPSAGSSG